MYLRDRKMLARLMLIQGISQRKLSEVAGWKSHTYMRRLVTGEATTLKAEPAVRIAHELGVPLDTLFLTKTDTNSGRNDDQRATRRGAA